MNVRTQVSRFPFPTVPNGWFHVAYSEAVPAGSLVPLEVLGRDLICYRGDGGVVHVMDAHCPHLGAHLGYGGHVKDDNVVCPFHGWAFDGVGANVDIPYSTRTNGKARLECWSVVEEYGEIFVWHDAEGRPPAWQLPKISEVGDASYVRLVGERWTIHSHVQDVMENIVDTAHFQYIHGTSGFGDAVVDEEGPMMRATASVQFVTPRGDSEGSVESELWGLGVDVVRPRGLVDAVAVFTATPTTEGMVELGYTFYVPKAKDGDGPSNIGRGMIQDFAKQGMQDTPIWEHKRYNASPALAAEDGPILRFRRWATQFYGSDPA